MSVWQGGYFAVGFLVAAILIPGWRRGTLRWYNVAIAVPLWPVILLGGWFSYRRLEREAREA